MLTVVKGHSRSDSKEGGQWPWWNVSPVSLTSTKYKVVCQIITHMRFLRMHVKHSRSFCVAENPIEIEFVLTKIWTILWSQKTKKYKRNCMLHWAIFQIQDCRYMAPFLNHNISHYVNTTKWYLHFGQYWVSIDLENIGKNTQIQI